MQGTEGTFEFFHDVAMRKKYELDGWVGVGTPVKLLLWLAMTRKDSAMPIFFNHFQR